MASLLCGNCTNLETESDQQPNPQDDHVTTYSNHQHCGERDGKPPNGQHLRNQTKKNIELCLTDYRRGNITLLVFR